MKICVRKYMFCGDRMWVEFRKDPVPFSGQRWGGWHALKHPKTAQEKRWASDKTHDKFIRPKRKAFNLPDSWDDKIMNVQKNWKKYRKHQYKGGVAT